jgi:hypothetical protein
MPPKRNIGEVDAEDELIDWSNEPIIHLKAELAARGLKRTGKKAELVARLLANIKSRDETDVLDLIPVPVPAQAAVDALVSTAPTSTGPTSTAPASSAKVSTPIKQKVKRTKKAKSPDVVIEGPLATEMIIHQHVDHATGERRLRPFVPEPDAGFKDKLKRIRKERMFLLARNMGIDKDGYCCEKFDIAGSSGNIYDVTIGRSPSCKCMDAVSYSG